MPSEHIMDEANFYNLHATASGAGMLAEKSSKKYAQNLMILHLHVEHKMGVRELSKRFNRKMVDVKNVICSTSSLDFL